MIRSPPPIIELLEVLLLPVPVVPLYVPVPVTVLLEPVLLPVPAVLLPVPVPLPVAPPFPPAHT
jgi:hypothetical protein